MSFSLNRYIIDVSALTEDEFEKFEKKLHGIANNTSIVDIPTTKFEAFFPENININSIKSLFPDSCIFTKIN